MTLLKSKTLLLALLIAATTSQDKPDKAKDGNSGKIFTVADLGSFLGGRPEPELEQEPVTQILQEAQASQDNQDITTIQTSEVNLEAPQTLERLPVYGLDPASLPPAPVLVKRETLPELGLDPASLPPALIPVQRDTMPVLGLDPASLPPAPVLVKREIIQKSADIAAQVSDQLEDQLNQKIIELEQEVTSQIAIIKEKETEIVEEMSKIPVTLKANSQAIQSLVSPLIKAKSILTDTNITQDIFKTEPESPKLDNLPEDEEEKEMQEPIESQEISAQNTTNSNSNSQTDQPILSKLPENGIVVKELSHQELRNLIRSRIPIQHNFGTDKHCGAYNGVGFCSFCFYSYYDFFERTCVLPPKKVENCIFYADRVRCMQCDFGFYLDQANNQCVQNEIEHCKVEIRGKCMVRLWHSDF